MEKTLRDELAMTMPVEAIPEMKNSAAIKIVAENYGLNYECFENNDLPGQIQFTLQYQAIIRYEYADMMLKVSGRYLER
jgi:hypothetical protein